MLRMMTYNGRQVDRRGYTLIELAITITILTAVTLVISGLAMALNEAAAMQEANITNMDEARMGMLNLTMELRQCLAGSIDIDDAELPADAISYTVPLDLDGNGNALDTNGDLEISNLRTISRDLNDANGDGLTETQLVVTEAGSAMVRVLANSLYNEDRNGNDTLDANEDLNGNGIIDTGVDFSFVDGALQIILTTGRTGKIGFDSQGNPKETVYVTTLSETVFPRN